ncbi:MAG: HPr family phosphocarrier protein [Kiritimatiellae bacterium]|nr:HPr family phosphocarrier protein [Kiritimatiellia bacterium]
MADDKLTKELTLKNKYGMHVRPAGLFAKIASRFNADVEVEKDGNVVSGKSIMALMTLEAVCGTTLKVTASGPQAKEVLEELEALVSRKFDIPDEQ